MVYSSDYLPIAHELIWISSCVLKCWEVCVEKVKGRNPEISGPLPLVGGMAEC